MENPYVWLDMETGGLNRRLENGLLGSEHYPILEIAAIVTDPNLRQTGQHIHLVIGLEPAMEMRMDPWARDQHERSGLLEKCRKSPLTLKEAEQILIQWLKDHGVEPFHRPSGAGGLLSGNSIGFDRSFILAQMPELHEYLHYQMVDVSSIRKGLRLNRVEKKYNHLALDDVRESIKELCQFRRQLNLV